MAHAADKVAPDSHHDDHRFFLTRRPCHLQASRVISALEPCSVIYLVDGTRREGGPAVDQLRCSESECIPGPNSMHAGFDLLIFRPGGRATRPDSLFRLIISSIDPFPPSSSARAARIPAAIRAEPARDPPLRAARAARPGLPPVYIVAFGEPLRAFDS